MKKIILTAAIFLGFLSVKQANAQVSFGINVNRQPQWNQPAYGTADYYYMPAIDAYYNIVTRQYVYFNGDQWIRRDYLPNRFRNYDVANSYKVRIYAEKPWTNVYYRNRYNGINSTNNRVYARNNGYNDDRYDRSYARRD
jgi:hypothetical protein